MLSANEKVQDRFLCIILVAAFTAMANCRMLLVGIGIVTVSMFVLLYLFCSVIPLLCARRLPTFRLRVCYHGAMCLRVFSWSLLFSIVIHIILACCLLPGRWTDLLWNVFTCFIVLFFLFWNGMICVYAASVQLGVRHRMIGLFCGLIPIANLIALHGIIRIVKEEVRFETEKIRFDIARGDQQICALKYPLLLVHGVFFRDYAFPNYWGRIPKELEKNGAVIYYGNHQSAASVADSAQELTRRIFEIVNECGCQKVNIIAHSKGGLDCRYAIAHLGAAPYVASLATINTPHRGCIFADYLLNKIPVGFQASVARKYNAALKRLGDRNPDFLSAVRDLTASACERMNAIMPVLPAQIYCHSVGSRLNQAVNGKFPLNVSYPLVKHFDGDNDGLVAESSFQFGEKYTLLQVKGKRGISHADMIDLNRENISGFDVREFYVQLVSDLRERGL